MYNKVEIVSAGQTKYFVYFFELNDFNENCTKIVHDVLYMTAIIGFVFTPNDE